MVCWLPNRRKASWCMVLQLDGRRAKRRCEAMVWTSGRGEANSSREMSVYIVRKEEAGGDMAVSKHEAQI